MAAHLVLLCVLSIVAFIYDHSTINVEYLTLILKNTSDVQTEL